MPADHGKFFLNGAGEPSGRENDLIPFPTECHIAVDSAGARAAVAERNGIVRARRAGSDGMRRSARCHARGGSSRCARAWQSGSKVIWKTAVCNWKTAVCALTCALSALAQNWMQLSELDRREAGC